MTNFIIIMALLGGLCYAIYCVTLALGFIFSLIKEIVNFLSRRLFKSVKSGIVEPRVIKHYVDVINGTDTLITQKEWLLVSLAFDLINKNPKVNKKKIIFTALDYNGKTKMLEIYYKIKK